MIAIQNVTVKSLNRVPIFKIIMLVRHWNKLSSEITDFIETEEWVGIPENKKQQMLLDLKDPGNMEATLHFSPGCDMIKFKIYRPNGPTQMHKMAKWVFIMGIADQLKQHGRPQ